MLPVRVDPSLVGADEDGPDRVQLGDATTATAAVYIDPTSRPPSLVLAAAATTAVTDTVRRRLEKLVADRPAWQRLLGRAPAPSAPLAETEALPPPAVQLRAIGIARFTAYAARMTHLRDPDAVLAAAYRHLRAHPRPILPEDMAGAAPRRRYLGAVQQMPPGLRCLADMSVPDVLPVECALYTSFLAKHVARALVQQRGIGRATYGRDDVGDPLPPTAGRLGLGPAVSDAPPDNVQVADETALALATHCLLALLGFAAGPDPRAMADTLAAPRVAALPDLVVGLAWDTAAALVCEWDSSIHH